LGVAFISEVEVEELALAPTRPFGNSASEAGL